MSNDLCFDRGDVIEFCDEEYIVVRGGSYMGAVCPIGTEYWIASFYWRFEGTACTFVRRATDDELKLIEKMGD